MFMTIINLLFIVYLFLIHYINYYKNPGFLSAFWCFFFFSPLPPFLSFLVVPEMFQVVFPMYFYGFEQRFVVILKVPPRFYWIFVVYSSGFQCLSGVIRKLCLFAVFRVSSFSNFQPAPGKMTFAISVQNPVGRRS